MQRLYTVGILLVALATVAAGCNTRQHGNNDGRLRDMESELAALRAQNLALQQPNAVVLESVPVIDPARRAKLESLGVKVTENGNSLIITLSNGILFDSGSARLKAASKRALDQTASVVKADLKDARIEICGHTDSKPIKRTKRLWKSNYELSVARANAVAAYIKGAGVFADSISVTGYGANRPISSNKTTKGRARNRRVEIIATVSP